MADAKLDPGFEEVALDEGFEEVPVTPAASSRSPSTMSAAEVEEADRLHQVEQGGDLIDAGLAGAAQGATFGFSDELGATKDVVVDAFTGNKLGKKWREYQKMREGANKALAEESPYAYGAGELAGGVASSLVMPGMGAAKVASTAARASPALGKFLAGQGASATARIAGKGANLAIQGAPVGLAYGLGASEHDINSPAELAMDGASGLGMGSITGMALGAGAQTGKEALKKAGSLINDSAMLSHSAQGYEMGKEGINLGSRKTQGELTLVPNEKAKNFVDKIMNVDSEIGQKVGAALEKAERNGITINVDAKIQSIGEKMFKNLFVDNPTLGEFVEPKTAKLLKLIANREQGNLSPTEARALKDQLYTLTGNLNGLGSDTAHLARSMGNDLAKEVDRALKTSIPDYQTAAREFETFRRLVPETIMSKGTPVDYGKVYMGNLKNPELKLFESTRDVLELSQMPGASAASEKSTFEMLRNSLKELENVSPSAVKGLGGSADDVINNLSKDSERLAAIRLSTGVDPQAGLKEAFKGSASGLSTTGRGLLVSGGNLAGRVVGATSKSTPVKMSKAIFNAGEQGLQDLSQRLKANQSTAILGDALENALVNKNEAGKNAVLFKLMQNPEYRNLLREEGMTEEE